MEIEFSKIVNVTDRGLHAIREANSCAGTNDEVWRSLWDVHNAASQLEHINSIASSIASCKQLLVIGIGGSALGLKAVHQALSSLDQSPTLSVLDNVDPVLVQETLSTIESADQTSNDTVVIVISKSGSTAEIAALLMVTQQVLPQAKYIAITEKSSQLHAYAISNGWETLPVPDGVGGRFSVLSNVGLFPAFLCHINCEELLRGAREMDQLCLKEDNNPALSLAQFLVDSYESGRSIHVLMPYCSRLANLSDWYVQLWAESLGKVDAHGNRVGPTPVAAIGATDQHSTLQLWQEGPLDKVIGFVNVTNVNDIGLGDHIMNEEFEWLKGKSLKQLIDAQQLSTDTSLQNAGQDTYTLTLPTLDAHAIGQFIALWQITVAIAGRMLQLNPYNQPGVELSKNLTRESLS